MGKIDETINLLKQLGMPKPQQNERSALTLLALLNLEEKNEWAKAEQRLLRVHDILVFSKEKYKKDYAENTRETIRRQTLYQFIHAGLVVLNPDDPKRPTNSPNNVYSVTSEALIIIKTYGYEDWESTLKEFVKNHGKLIDRYRKIKKKQQISLEIDKRIIKFSPGKHNELQVIVITDLKPRFFPNAEVLYVGDAAKKMLQLNKEKMNELKVPLTKHDKLPDLVFFDKKSNVLFLVESVTSHGPISPKRQIELEVILKDCTAKKVYISAFPDVREFKRHLDNIAWETEVWIASEPDHMVHFNGPKFLDVNFGE